MTYIPITVTGKIEVENLRLSVEPECNPLEDGGYEIYSDGEDWPLDITFSDEVYADVCDQVRAWVREHRHG